MNDWILDVSTLNRYVSDALGADPVLRSMRLRGEVSGFKAYPSGHWYFTLKDERCRISCVMFRQHAMRMSMRPHDGDQVILHGAVRLYEEGGTYQFVADSMRPEGVGSLYQQFERLKAKLQEEGLFDAARKRNLPVRPRKIAVVTSVAGAVLHDIRMVSARRDPGVPLVLLPVAVQGEGAAEQIAAAVRKAGTLPLVDVIIVGRGGGSMEDLWAFNEEIVARAIAASPVPVISAVGHETDFTIADFTADVRAATPSQAAELAVPDRSELEAAMKLMVRRFEQAAQKQLDQTGMRLLRADRRLQAMRPDRQLEELQRAVTALRVRMDRCVDERFARLPDRLSMAAIRMDNAVDQQMTSLTQRMSHAQTKLEAISPQRVLERGYALVSGPKGIITGAAHTTDEMQIQFHDGIVNVYKQKEDAHGC